MLAIASLISWLSLAKIGGNFAALDLRAYWVAAQTLSQGENPYDKDTLIAAEKRLFPKFEHYIPVWNPPWAFTLILPLTHFGLETATVLMMTLNIFLAIPLAYALNGIFSGTKDPLPSVFLAAFLFIPFWEVVEYGQLSTILATAMAFGVLNFTKGRDISAGMFFSLLTIKPHLGFLLSLAVLLRTLKERRFGVLVGGLIGVTLLAAAILVIEPRSLSWWLAAEKPLEFEATTFITVLRLQLVPVLGAHNAHLTWLLPLICCALSIPLILRRADVHRYASPLLCISSFLAPYGWIFDHVLLIYVPLEILCRVIESKHSRRVAAEVWLWILLLALYRLSFRLEVSNQMEFCYFALWLLLFWLRCDHLLRSPARESQSE